MLGVTAIVLPLALHKRKTSVTPAENHTRRLDWFARVEFVAVEDLMERIANFFLDDGDFPERTQKLLGLIFLSLAIFLAFQDYESKFLFFIQKTNSLKPGFASGIFGLLLLSPMYLRGIYRWRPSVYGVTQFILLLTVVSSFISVILPRSLTGTMFLIVCFLVVLAWLGIKDIAKNV